MAKLNPKAVLKPAVSLFLICLIVTALLAGVNMLTADRIAALAVQTAEDSQKVVLPNAASFEEVDEDTVKGLDGSGQLAGYVITTEAKGYGGTPASAPTPLRKALRDNTSRQFRRAALRSLNPAAPPTARFRL